MLHEANQSNPEGSTSVNKFSGLFGLNFLRSVKMVNYKIAETFFFFSPLLSFFSSFTSYNERYFTSRSCKAQHKK
jgi:hypothetical protein